MKGLIEKTALKKWARILLNHSLGGIELGERVMIKGEAVCWELMAELEHQIIMAGGIPDVCLVPPNNCRGMVWSADMGQYGTTVQLDSVPDWHGARYESMGKYVEVLGNEDPSKFNCLSAERSGLLARADHPFRTIRLEKPWVLTLFPTETGAAFEGFGSLEEYAAFLVEASTSDPQAVRAAEERLSPFFQQAKTMTLHTKMPGKAGVLILNIELGRTLVQMCYGQYNWPDGEIFRSPDPRHTEGEIYLDLPISYQGQTIRGIYLKFVDGKVVEYFAQEGHDTLRSIVETDAGSHRLGEAALGMNPGLKRVLKEPLYTEKVGGTLHIALGESYPECYARNPKSPEGLLDIQQAKQNGTFNDSARHVDVVVDFRPGGAGAALWLDATELIVENGLWVPKFNS